VDAGVWLSHRSNHETNHLRYTGDVPHGSHNYGGIGATGGVTGRGYESIDAGVLACCAHQACYTWGKRENWPAHLQQYWNASTRYAAVMANEWAGKVKLWRDFVNGAWAYTDSLPRGTLANGYAANCVAKANRVLSQPGGSKPVALFGWMTDIRHLLATASGAGRGPTERIPMSEKRGLVVHFRGATRAARPGWHTFAADAQYHVDKDWDTGPGVVRGTGIMYHVGIGFDGEAYLMRDLDRVLWHCGAWPQNANTLAIQVPLNTGDMPTPEQLKTLERISVEWFEFTKADRRTELWGHKQLSSTACPGELMPTFVLPWRAGTIPGNPTPTPQPPPSGEDIEIPGYNGLKIPVYGGIYEAWKAQGAIGVWGYPLEAEHDATYDSSYVREQWFQRGLAKWRPGANPPTDVHFDLLGVTAWEKIHGRKVWT
jgi:hypothetical protein